MPLILGANSVSGYSVANSLRFNSGSTDNLQRTFSSGNRKTYTLSFWIKKTAINQVNYIFESLQDGNNYGQIYFNTDNFGYESYIGANQFQLITSQVFRDVSAWYHIVVSIDTTQATSSNRGKIYVNGSLVSLGTSIYPSQNYDTFFNQNKTHTIGANTYSGFANLLNGYLTEFYFIDGQALDPSYFGETDTLSGVWKPKAYTGTFGTNGFYLKFANSASLGADSSGNGNNFTVNNLTSIDQSTDTPTNNFCTLNPLYKGSTAPNITEGNLKATNSGASNYQGAFGTIPASTTGKWYWEFKSGSSTNGSTTETVFGAVRETRLSAASNQSGEYAADGIHAYGSFYSITSGDIIGVTVDRTSAELKIYKNNSLIITKTSLFDELLFPYIAVYGSGINIECNFGNPPYSGGGYTDGAGYGNFSYAVPSGYYALNTKNLANFG